MGGACLAAKKGGSWKEGMRERRLCTRGWRCGVIVGSGKRGISEVRRGKRGIGTGGVSREGVKRSGKGLGDGRGGGGGSTVCCAQERRRPPEGGGERLAKSWIEGKLPTKSL